MTSVQDAIKNRTTCLEYTKKKVSKKILKSLVDSARMAPSSHNSQDWSFVVITKPEIIEKLTSLCYYGAFYSIPPALIACVAHPLYQSKTSLQENKVGERVTVHKYLNLGFAADHLVLSATALKLQTSILSPEISATNKILKVPKGYETVLLISVGYGVIRKKATRKTLNEVIRYETFS